MPPSEAGAEITLFLERAVLQGLAWQQAVRFEAAGELLVGM